MTNRESIVDHRSRLVWVFTLFRNGTAGQGQFDRLVGVVGIGGWAVALVHAAQ